MALTIGKTMLGGMFFMLMIVGFSIFVGGIYGEYPDTSVNDSFETTYNKMADLYTESNQLQSNLIKNDTFEGDPTQDFNWFDAFGVIKDAFVRLPKILFSTLAIMIGVTHTFADTIGIPRQIIDILIAIASVSLSIVILKVIIGRR